MDTKTELLLEQWKLASELHRHEDNLTWNKFYYFVTLNSGLLGAFGATMVLTDGVAVKILFLLFISLLGTVVSSAWCVTQERGRMQQRLWIHKAVLAEKLIRTNPDALPILTLYKADLNASFRGKLPFLAKFRTQKIIVILAGSMAVFWFLAFSTVALIAAGLLLIKAFSLLSAIL